MVIIKKDLEMLRLSWVDPKCNHVYSYKREAEGDFDTHQRRRYVKTEAGIRMLQPQARKTNSHQKLQEARN